MTIRFLILLGLLFWRPATAQLRRDPSLLKVIDSSLSIACAQYKYLAAHTPADALPRTYQDDKWVTSDPGWWTSGFFSGTLVQLFTVSHDTALKGEALRRMQLLTREQFNRGTHDLGFMMFCSFGNDLLLLGDTDAVGVLMNSARSLSTRFNPTVGCIRSWDNKRWQYPVIIDNMMNLELLLWATAHSGDSSFYRIAVTHANTTLRNHFRPDHSSYHVVDYDTTTGAIRARVTAQGFSDSSAWARGQSWGLYGYTMMYRGTKDQRYLVQANQIARYLLSRLPADKIPFWDYDDPHIPNTYRDASAAAVLADALIELSRYVPFTVGKTYLGVAETILRTLCSPAYRAAPGENGGFILRHSVGHLPGHSEVDVPLTYADYYFVEAMRRYRAIGKIGTVL